MIEVLFVLIYWMIYYPFFLNSPDTIRWNRLSSIFFISSVTFNIFLSSAVFTRWSTSFRLVSGTDSSRDVSSTLNAVAFSSIFLSRISFFIWEKFERLEFMNRTLSPLFWIDRRNSSLSYKSHCHFLVATSREMNELSVYPARSTIW